MMRLIAFACLAVVAFGYPTKEFEDVNALEHPWESESKNFRVSIISRSQWGARAATGSSRLATPVANVIIHHTVTASCTSLTTCSQSMRSMQNFHMNTNGWADIGYNFAVGGDGAVYEGRGWTVLGAHATNWNSNSLGIAFIGTFTSASPNQAQINAARNLITLGMNNGFISRNHRLMGHRQAGSTECPGNALYNIIRTWPNFRSATIDEEN